MCLGVRGVCFCCVVGLLSVCVCVRVGFFVCGVDLDFMRLCVSLFWIAELFFVEV